MSHPYEEAISNRHGETVRVGITFNKLYGIHVVRMHRTDQSLLAAGFIDALTARGIGNCLAQFFESVMQHASYWASRPLWLSGREGASFHHSRSRLSASYSDYPRSP